MVNADEQEADMRRLFVKEARVDCGPHYRRWRPKDRGRAPDHQAHQSHRGDGGGTGGRVAGAVDGRFLGRACIRRESGVGQKVNPIGFRIGITEDWRSRWFAPKAAFSEFLIEDHRIRKYIDDKLNKQPPYAAVAKVEIERTRNELKVLLHTARPGLVIGPKVREIEKLKEQLENLIDRNINLNIMEIKVPDANAKLMAEAVSEQLKKRAGFRRVMKMRIDSAMACGAKGVKIMCSGRLGGSEMARRETQARSWVSRFLRDVLRFEVLLFAAFYLARQGYLDIGDTYIIAT